MLALAGSQLLGAGSASAAPGPILQPTAALVTADALPTAQINGVVYSQAIAGNTVYAGGEFTSARPAGASAGSAAETPRHNLVAYDIRTGELLSSFAPDVNGRIKAVRTSADNKTLYIAGSFTQVDGVKRERVASFDIATGALTSFSADANGTVAAIAVLGDVLYLGGSFSTVKGITRSRLAAVSTPSGTLLAWAPKADDTVLALTATPDKTRIIAGGAFAKLGTTTALGMGSLSATTGAVQPWLINTVVKDYGTTSAVYSLSSDATTVYGTGYNSGAGNFEGAFAAVPSTGAVKWLQDCHGDTYDVAAVGGVVYSVGHPHYCTNIGGFPDTNPRVSQRAMAVTTQATGTVRKNGQLGSAYHDFEGQPAPSLFNWFPDLMVGEYTGASQAAWSVAANSQYVVLGGEFLRANGKPQQGLVRLAVTSLAPNARGPQDRDFNLTPHTAKSVDSPPVVTAQQSSLTVSWKANWDQDDQVLTYDVLRDGAVVQTLKATSQFWNRRVLSYSDRNGSPGASYTYSIRARDPHGNTVTSPSVTAVYPSDAAYAQLVAADGAAHQWRLGSTPGSVTAADVASLPMSVKSGVTFGVQGAIPADSDTAADFTGSTQTAPEATPGGVMSIESWFKTTADGAALVGLGAGDRSAPTTAGDRQVYLNTTGHLTFAERPSGSTKPVATSPKAYNDGKWHQVVAVHSATALTLYVDGSQVATVASTATLPSGNKQWTLGGATPGDLPGHSTGSADVSLDEVSVFGSALSARQVRNHYLAAQPGYGTVSVRPSTR